MKARLACVIAVVTLALSLPVLAQQGSAAAPIKRTLLQKVDVPGSSNYETVTGVAEIAPNVNIGRHTHPGAETGYVIEGTMTLLVEGKPPLTLNAGDSYQIPVNAVHDARSGDKTVKVLAVYIVEKGKPLASSAP
ncbi:MAG TPA: cupin domain-containing protein [Casimicrobiaceae bacterium]|nr:cupin domain-containing protein [Casimicrobiaceae bacterium]